MINREDFEKWAKDKGFDVLPAASWHCFTYHSASTEDAWRMWQDRQTEIDALKADLLVANENWENAHADLIRKEEHIAALKAEVERLRKDAERYQWVRDNVEEFGEELQCVDDEDSGGYYSRYILPSECDEAIDTAMKETK